MGVLAREGGFLGHVLHRLSEEQKEAIEWISFQMERGGYYPAAEEPLSLSFHWPCSSQLKGLKVVVRKTPLHPYDWDAIEKFVADRNCRIIEEEMVRIDGSYGAENREEIILRMQDLLSWRNERSVVGK